MKEKDAIIKQNKYNSDSLKAFCPLLNGHCNLRCLNYQKGRITKSSNENDSAYAKRPYCEYFNKSIIPKEI